jgi:hypothetical protein
MFQKVLDMQILLPASLVFDQAPGAEKLLDEGLDVELVVREDLTFKLLGRSVEASVVVCEVPCGDEE